MKTNLLLIVLTSFAFSACTSSESPSDAAKEESQASDAADDKPSPIEAAEAIRKKMEENPLGAMMGAMKELEKSGAVRGGKVVNWRKLADFAPAELGDYKSSEDLKGETTGIGPMQVTTVTRKYKSGETTVKLTITDTNLAPAIRAPFAMVHMINEDTSEGYHKGIKVSGQPGIAEWVEKSAHSQITMLISERYVVAIEMDKAKVGNAEALAAKLNLDGLSGLKAE